MGVTPRSYATSDLINSIKVLYNAKPYILRISASCNQPYGTYDWEGNGSVVDAISGTTIFSTGSKGTYYFTYNGRSYRASLDGDTVYGEYNPWVSFSVYDNTKGASVATSTGDRIRVYWNGSSYQSI
jgi:hypothetical protein